jgi:hypothetical protein
MEKVSGGVKRVEVFKIALDTSKTTFKAKALPQGFFKIGFSASS